MYPILKNRCRTGFLTATLLVVGLSGCAPQQTTSDVAANAPPVQGTPRGNPPARNVTRVTVPQGTSVHVVLSTAIGSATSQVGDDLIATTTAPVLVGNNIAIPEGSTIRGEVTSVDPATKGLKISEKGGSLVLSFDSVTPRGGGSTPLSASLSSFAKSGGKTAGIIGGSAAGGALLGKILGGSTKDAAVGAVVGGGIGTGIAAGTKGKEVVIPADTHLILTLDQSLTLTDRS